MNVLLIILSATLFNHLGLAEAVTFHTKKNLILNCSKCLTFWTVLGYCIFTKKNIIVSVATAFIAAYLALWVELLLTYLNFQYWKIWKQIKKRQKAKQ